MKMQDPSLGKMSYCYKHSEGFEYVSHTVTISHSIWSNIFFIFDR